MQMVSATIVDRSRAGGTFYVWMAAACAAIAFGGFAPTYWLQLTAGTFVGPPLLHFHGALFFGWTVLLLSQTALAANGQLDHHRAWGLAGIGLASAMVVVGIAAAINTLNVGLAAGYGDRARAFMIIPVSAIGLFAGFVATAIVNIKRPDVHKRLMVLATLSLLQAAMGRIFFVIFTGGGPGLRPGLGPPPPLAIGLVPSLIPELLIVAGMIYDWRTRGRPHPAWIIGAVVITLVVVLRGMVADTSVWLATADFLAGFNG
jgi:hypothetical protein